MAQVESPLTRSIGLSGLIRWLLAVFAMIAIGAALSAHRYVLAIAGLIFFLIAIGFAYRAWRARQAADTALSPRPPA